MAIKLGQTIMQFILAIFMIYVLTLILKQINFNTFLGFFIILFLIWASIMWILKELGIIR